MLRFDEALRQLLALATPTGAERVGLDAAAGRVLAEDVVVASDLPPFDASVMDGYAVRAGGFTGEGPWEFPVAGESRAGAPADALADGAVARVFTGAELPRGADAVVMQEEVERLGDRARFVTAPKPGAFVRRRGDDLRRGDVALSAGTRLRPAHLALAATADRAWLHVARRPRVVFLATGDELRAPGAPPFPGSIVESNTVGLRAMAERAGADVGVAPFVPDRLDATVAAFEDALARADVVVSIGGVSVGDHDRVRPALEAAGVALEFYRVAIKPGKPLAVGRRGAQRILGLPGNPVSAMVTFALFGAPFLRAMQGDRAPSPAPLRARVDAPFDHAPGRLEFARVRLERRGGELWAHPLSNQASGAIVALARADALMAVPAESAGLAEGDAVDVHLLAELGA